MYQLTQDARLVQLVADCGLVEMISMEAKPDKPAS